MAATLTFNDDFDSLSLWNGTSGTWSTNYYYNPLEGNGGSLSSNGEQEWYINSNDPATSSVVPWTVSNGILTITGSTAPTAIQPLINNYQYVSGELNTYNSFSQEYGYFEARIEVPAGQGLWPAFWMIPENGSWPPEIDIMEILGNNPTVLYTSLHSGTASDEISSAGTTTIPDASAAYHEYAVDWTASTITFYFDGKAVYSEATPSDMDVAMYMELDLAMGGTWPGDINSTTPLPAQMRVANVEAYSSNPNPITTQTVFTANGTAGELLIGSPGNDVFYAGTNSVIMTGEGLANTYIYTALPTAAGQITDFDPGVDTVDVSAMLHALGYTGTNPFGDGTLRLVSDGNGGTDLTYNPASGAAVTIVDFDNVAESAFSTSTDFITAYTGSTATSTSSSTSTGTSTSTTGSSTSTGTATSTSSTASSSSTSTGSVAGSGGDPEANNTPGQILTATTPSDIFQAGQNSVVMTEDGGSNIFVYTALPWNAGQITNFNPALDKIDVSAMLTSAGYTGTNPFGDGTLSLNPDGHGGTMLMYNPPGAGSNGNWSTAIVDIDNVAASAINVAADFVISASSTSTGSTSTGSTSTGTSTSTTGSSTSTGTATSTSSTASSSSTSTGSVAGSGGDPEANNTPGQILTATTPSDIFQAGQNSVVMTEDGGSNLFVYTALPWNAGQITNFNPALDKIDVSAMLTSAGYTGTNPFGDGTLSLNSDGHGGTMLMYNPPGAGSNGNWSTAIVDIDNVAASAINVAADFVISASSTSTGSTSTGSTSTGSTSAGSTSTGSTTTVTTPGVTLTGNDIAGQVLTATTPNDTFQAGQNSVVMTGDGGSNDFVFNALPWNVGQITNFNPASDKIDVSGILHAAGYTGTNPFADGTLTLTSDGNGGSLLMYNPPGAGSNGNWSTAIVDIDHMTASSLNTATDFITSAIGTSSTTSTDTGSTGTGSTTAVTTPGITLTGNDIAGQVLTATTPNDIFQAGQNSVVMTGDGGSNDFVFNALPWNVGQITNFNPASDKIDVSGILHTEGYTGTNPFADGTLTLTSDGNGGSLLMYNPLGAGSNGNWSTAIVDIDHMTASSLNTATDFIVSSTQSSVSDSISTSTSTSTTTTPGVTLTGSDTAGQVLAATTPNDTFVAGQNSVVMTEDGGTNSFVFAVLPWNAGQITNFNPAFDTINVSGILQTAGYAGTNPFGDGTLSLVSDGQGGTNLMYNPPGAGSNGVLSTKIVDLDHVTPASVNLTKDFIFH